MPVENERDPEDEEVHAPRGPLDEDVDPELEEMEWKP